MIKKFKIKALPKKFKTSYVGIFNERLRVFDATKHVPNRCGALWHYKSKPHFE